VEHVSLWWTVRNHRGFWWGNLKEKGLLEGLGIDGRKILKWIFKMWDEDWTGLI